MTLDGELGTLVSVIMHDIAKLISMNGSLFVFLQGLLANFIMESYEQSP